MRILSGACIRAVGLVLAITMLCIPAVTAQTIATPAATPPVATPAVTTPKFSIYPVGEYKHRWFEVTIDAGASANLTAGIANAGDVPVTLNTYATNVSSAPNGGFLAGDADDPPAGPTQWVDYDSADLTLQPDESVEHAFTVTVPADTKPGFYVVALVAQTADSLAIPGTEVLRQVIRNAVSVEITVPGDATSGFDLGVPAASSVGDQWVLDIPITNTGTTRLKPAGTLVVADVDGGTVATIAVKMESVYEGATTSVRTILPKQLPAGEYRVSLNLTDKATGASNAITDVSFTIAAP